MKKLIAIIAIIASFGGQAQQYIDAGNTQVVGVVEDSISNPVDFIVLDSENKFRKVSKDSLGGSFETAANGGIYVAGRDEDNYGDIGNNAFDASFSDSNSSIYGATGDYSTAFGYATEASGEFSAAFGEETIASGYASTALGSGAVASGNASTAFGSATEALNDLSVAMGSRNDMSLTPNALFQVGNGSPGYNNNAYTLNKDATSYQDGIAFYNEDYSANYTDRSLVDKGYVDSEIANQISDSLDFVDLDRVLENGNSSNNRIILNEGTLGLGGLNNGSGWDFEKYGTDDFSFGSDSGKNFSLSLSTLTNQRTYTLPDENGTFALVEQVNDTLSNYPLYSEGTFTGTFEGSTSGSVSTGTQNYVRIGNQVTVYISFLGDLSTLVGSISITGLPALSGTIQDNAVAAVSHGDGIRYPTGGGTHPVTLLSIVKGGEIQLLFNDVNSAQIALSDSDISGSSHSFNITMTYRIE